MKTKLMFLFGVMATIGFVGELKINHDLKVMLEDAKDEEFGWASEADYHEKESEFWKSKYEEAVG